jgi:hypothetical protein
MIEGFLPRRFRKFDVSTDLAAEYGLKAANEIADDAARANRNAPHNAEMPDGLETYDIICRRDHHGKDSEAEHRAGSRKARIKLLSIVLWFFLKYSHASPLL